MLYGQAVSQSYCGEAGAYQLPLIMHFIILRSFVEGLKAPVKRSKLFTQQYTAFGHHFLHVVLVWGGQIRRTFCQTLLTRELNKV